MWTVQARGLGLQWLVSWACIDWFALVCLWHVAAFVRSHSFLIGSHVFIFHGFLVATGPNGQHSSIDHNTGTLVMAIPKRSLLLLPWWRQCRQGRTISLLHFAAWDHYDIMNAASCQMDQAQNMGCVSVHCICVETCSHFEVSGRFLADKSDQRDSELQMCFRRPQKDDGSTSKQIEYLCGKFIKSFGSFSDKSVMIPENKTNELIHIDQNALRPTLQLRQNGLHIISSTLLCLCLLREVIIHQLRIRRHVITYLDGAIASLNDTIHSNDIYIYIYIYDVGIVVRTVWIH